MVVKKNLNLVFAITALGVSSVITQITFTRELLNLFNGNELVLGLVLSVWLLLGGAGAWLGRLIKYRKAFLVGALVLVAFLPLGHLAVLRTFHYALVGAGVILDVRALFVCLPLVLLPYCVISGALLTLACSMFSAENRNVSLGAVYFVDTIGDILGGALFTFVLVFLTTNFNALYVPWVLNLAAALVVSRRYGFRKTFALLALLGVGCVCLAARVDLDARTLAALFPHQEIVEAAESPYGRIVVTRDEEQLNVYENSIPLYSTNDVLGAEETVHYPLSLLADRELAVLLVSGGVAGSPKEVLKYRVARLDYVELDPEIVRIGRQFTDSLDDPRITIHLADGRRFAETTEQRYDAVILDVPAPENIQLNRFYTVEFLTLLKARLKPGGLVSFALPGVENYVSEELAALYGMMHATASAVFRNVVVLPAGETLFILTDDASVTPRKVREAVRNLPANGVSPQYVNQHFVDGILTPDRTEEVKRQAQRPARVNRDLFPSGLSAQLEYWLSYFNADVRWLLVLFGVAGVVFVLVLPAPELALWTTGFAGAGLEIVLLFLLQVHSGYVYHKFGLVVTLFMAGLAAGSLLATRAIAAWGPARSRKLLQRLDLAILAYLIGTWLLVGHTPLWRSDGVLYCLMLAVAAMTGAQFPAAGVLYDDKISHTAGRLYFADFAGSGIGAFLTGLLLVPGLGIRGAILVIVCLKTASIIKCGLRK